MTAPIIGTLLRVLDRTAAIAPMRNPISDKGIDAAMIAPASHERTPEPARKGNTTVLTTGTVIPRMTDHLAVASMLSFNGLLPPSGVIDVVALPYAAGAAKTRWHFWCGSLFANRLEVSCHSKTQARAFGFSVKSVTHPIMLIIELENGLIGGSEVESYRQALLTVPVDV